MRGVLGEKNTGNTTKFSIANDLNRGTIVYEDKLAIRNRGY
jgi:hypothetical protein